MDSFSGSLKAFMVSRTPTSGGLVAPEPTAVSESGRSMESFELIGSTADLGGFSQILQQYLAEGGAGLESETSSEAESRPAADPEEPPHMGLRRTRPVAPMMARLISKPQLVSL
ncbi:unnamed protein product [Effrenium voratum]|nr:unnamed protein product [Effrenium voratum]